MRDKLWLFAAGRYETANLPNTFAQNGAGYTRTDTNRRGELKITGTFAASQTVQASFIGNATEQVNASALNAAALLDASMLTTRQLPNRLMALNYHGSITPLLYADAQYSEKKQSVRNNGGTSTDIRNSPFRTAGVTPACPAGWCTTRPTSTRPTPRAVTTGSSRAAWRICWRRASFGSHELKGGGEYFVNEGIGGNSQSSTGDRLRDRLPDVGRRAGARRDRQAGACLHARPDRDLDVHRQARRGDRHHDDVVLPAGSLGGDAPADARSRHADRDRQFERHGDVGRGEHDVDRSAAGRRLRPAGERLHRPVRDLRPLFRQVQPGAVRREHQRRPAGRSRLLLLRSGGPGLRLCARRST